MLSLPARSAPARLRRFAALALAATLLLGVAAAPATAHGPQPSRVDFWLTILHNNDAESKLLPSYADAEMTQPYAGVSRFKTMVAKQKWEALTRRPSSSPFAKRGVVMLSSGDNFLAGAQWAASIDRGVPFYDSRAIDLIGYDAMGIGNHEFDFGPDVLADFIRGTRSWFSFLSANLDVSAEPTLAALEKKGRIASSAVIRERGEKIGIVGITTPQLPNISSPRNVTVDPDVVEAIQDEVDRLSREGIDKIILISHLQNVAEDLALAGELRRVDVIIAGGGDELLADPGWPLAPGDTSPYGEYPLRATDAAGTSVPVITTNGDFKYVGRLVVGFDRRGRVKVIDEARSGPIRVVGFGPDAVAPNRIMDRRVVEPVAAFVDGLSQNVLAQSAVPLNGKRGTVDGSQNITDPGVRNSETNLGNLTADSLLWAAQQKAAEFGVDAPQVALQNGGGIRNNNVIPAGPITELNTYEILAFTNFVAVKEDLTPEQFKAVLETSVSEIGNGRFGQWAGVEFSYDPSAQKRVIDASSPTCDVSNPGSRIQDVSVGGVQVFDDGVFVGPVGWTVDISTNDFTFRGGDCYDFGPGGFTTVGVVYQQALAEYLVAPAVDGGLAGQITAADYPVGGEGRIIRLP